MKKKDIAKKMGGYEKKLASRRPAGKAIDMTDFFRKKAGEGVNMFGLVNHIDGKKIKKKAPTHDEMLKKHPGLKNKYGDNYPTGYVPD